MGYIIEFVFLASPVMALIFFLVSLIVFLHAKSANKKSPGTYSANQIINRRVLLIVSSVIAAVFLAVAITIIGLLYMALAHM